jgi:Asp-tRNA(Asn)/Glu-tRNA(Gln) amidotransferase B subunit
LEPPPGRGYVAQPHPTAGRAYQVDAIIAAKSLQQISNEDELRKMVASVLDSNPQAVVDFKKGKKPEQVAGFIRGQVMKQTHGKANSALVQQLVAEELVKRTGG